MNDRGIPATWDPNHPFAGKYGITCGVEDRTHKIRQSTDMEWLRRVLACDDLGVTVRTAAERRLRKLAKARKEAA